MSLNADDIRTIVDALEKSEWDQATVTVGDTRISVARNGMPLEGQAAGPVPPGPVAQMPQPVPAPTAAASSASPQATASASTQEAAPEGHVIESPSVGVFWSAPQPGAAPFVEVGSKVKAGDTVGIVEVMKLMTNIAADVSGEVIAIHVDNAGAVEYGSPLLTIRAVA